jgi:hypothetical protein
MYIPKRYGQSKIDKCPFCDKNAVTENSQGVPVCASHKSEVLQNLKCVCGRFLETRKGKFGAYFNCMNCGNINFKKAMEMNTVSKPEYKVTESRDVKKAYKEEITVRSDELDYL